MSAKTGTLYWLPRILGDDQLDAASALILIGLADHVGQDDTCYVGFERLAEYGRCSYNTARRRVAELQERGWLEKAGRRRNEAGNLSVYVWRLVRHDESLAPTVGGRDDGPLAPTEESLAPKSGGPSAHPGGRAEPPCVEPPDLEPPRAGESLFVVPAIMDETDQVGFEQFVWEHYPRRDGKRVGKGEAIKAWLRLAQPQRDRAIRNLAHYVASGVRAMDCHRWLRPGHPGGFEDWDDPAVADPVGPSPRQQRKATANAQFVRGEQPTGGVGRALYGEDETNALMRAARQEIR